MKKILAAIVLLLVAGCSERVTNEFMIEPELPEKVTVDLTFFGDIFWGRRVQTWSENSELKEAYPFSALDTFDKKPYENWIGNVECPVTTTEVSQSEQENQLRFNCRPSYLPHLAKYFDIVSLANNHTDNVNGQVGLDETRKNLEAHNIQHFGHFNNKVIEDVCEVVSVQGQAHFESGNTNEVPVAIALCAQHNVFALPPEESIAAIEAYAKLMPTFVLPHQGREYVRRPDQFQQQVFRKFIDYGADAVIAGHPHSVMSTEVRDGKLVVYSLGNFIFDQQGNEMKRTGLVVHADIEMKFDEARHLLGLDCSSFKTDSCLERITYAKREKPEIDITYSAEVSDNSNKLVKKASPEVRARTLQFANWEQTMQKLQQ